ncbi:MAG: hypothetical protein ACT4RN_10905 [Pseudonocardia sp.]
MTSPYQPTALPVDHMALPEVRDPVLTDQKPAAFEGAESTYRDLALGLATARDDVHHVIAAAQAAHFGAAADAAAAHLRALAAPGDEAAVAASRAADALLDQSGYTARVHREMATADPGFTVPGWVAEAAHTVDPLLGKVVRPYTDADAQEYAAAEQKARDELRLYQDATNSNLGARFAPFAPPPEPGAGGGGSAAAAGGVGGGSGLGGAVDALGGQGGALAPAGAGGAGVGPAGGSGGAGSSGAGSSGAGSGGAGSSGAGSSRPGAGGVGPVGAVPPAAGPGGRSGPHPGSVPPPGGHLPGRHLPGGHLPGGHLPGGTVPPRTRAPGPDHARPAPGPIRPPDARAGGANGGIRSGTSTYGPGPGAAPHHPPSRPDQQAPAGRSPGADAARAGTQRPAGGVPFLPGAGAAGGGDDTTHQRPPWLLEDNPDAIWFAGLPAYTDPVIRAETGPRAP